MTRCVGSLFVAGVAVLFALAGCARPASVEAGASPAGGVAPYRVVCTVGMVTDIVRQVAGDRAEVSGIIGAGVDPHLYRPTRSDVSRLMEADVVFYSGLMLEGKMAEVLEKVAALGKPVWAVAERVDREFLLEAPEFQGQYDPHLWMDVAGWMKVVEVVEACLSRFDPAGSAGYRARADTLLQKMEALDRYAREAVATIPAEARLLVTAHDAFNYFGRAYGIEVVGIQGISTASEAGLKDLIRLVDLIVDRKVPAVFVETSVSEKNVRALVEGAAARGWRVALGGSLYSDAMGPPGSYEGTYIGMIDHNVTTIVRALGGRAPEGGMQGKLRSGRAGEGLP